MLGGVRRGGGRSMRQQRHHMVVSAASLRRLTLRGQREQEVRPGGGGVGSGVSGLCCITTDADLLLVVDPD